jgi:hypothetical protein|tara:strand:- start:13 stop:165 length:153 start_codon:yes stop_codon:yes gene_type:complete
LFHQLAILKPLKKPILKATNHFKIKNPNQKIETLENNKLQPYKTKKASHK